MTPFEQFVAREYGRKEGDPIDDIYDEARARWKQQRTMPMDTNARAAQGVFDSLPTEPTIQAGAVDLSRNQRADLSAPAQTSADQFNLSTLMTPTNRSVFDDLPDTEPVRQSQLTEMEIAQRRNSGATEAQQPKALPDELVQQAWRMFADDYRDFSTWMGGAMKSEPRKALINEYTQGFAQNYAPVLGVTLAEAEALARNAAKENRPIQMSDWKGTSESAQRMPDVKTINDAVSAAKGLREFGREEEAQQLLQSVGVVKPRSVYDDVETLLGETAQLQAAQRIGKLTMPDGTVLGKDEIETKLAETQNKLVGYKPALAMTPSEEGRHLNINEIVPQFTSDKGVNVAKLNSHVRQLAEKYPNLKAHMNGEIVPASEFQYTIPKAAPEEEEDTRSPEEREAAMTERVRRLGGTLGRAALGVGKGLLEGARAIR